VIAAPSLGRAHATVLVAQDARGGHRRLLEHAPAPLVHST
jgi:hypothetical protein